MNRASLSMPPPAALASGWPQYAALALIAVGFWQVAPLTGTGEWRWLAATGAVAVAGSIALDRLRPSRDAPPAPKLMLLLSLLGMLAGLWLDRGYVGLNALASICTAGAAPDFLKVAALHAQGLPWMHAGMVGGGLLTVPLLRSAREGGRHRICGRFVQNLGCSAWMVAGMSAGVLGVHRLTLTSGGIGSAAMLWGMVSGMVLGMVMSVATYRIYFRLRERCLGRRPSPL